MSRVIVTASVLAAILLSACSPAPVSRPLDDDAARTASSPPELREGTREIAPAQPDVTSDVPLWHEDTVATDASIEPFDAGILPDVTAPEDITQEDVVAPVDVVVPRDVVAPVDVVVPADVGVLPAIVGVPRIDASLKATLRAVYARGVSAGNRPSVFAKIGDSITESASFLMDFGPARGSASWNLGAFGALDPTVVYFNATLVDATHSSFDRESLGAVAGWTTTRALSEGESLIRQELAALRPAAAVVMFGSADIEVLEASEVGVFRANLTRIVQIVLAVGTIPVLSTVPDRTDSPSSIERTPAFNAAIREVAAAQRVPLQEYWAALQSIPRHGLSEDGVHPSVYRTPEGQTEAAYFTPPALAFGYNVRNLTSLASLAHLRAVVFQDGPPDP